MLILIKDWRDLQAVCGIYRITQAGTDREYYGSARNIRLRVRKHFIDLERGVHHSQVLQRVSTKYGVGILEVEIVELVDDPAQLLSREQHYIDSRKPLFNVCRVAGSCAGIKHTPQTRAKRSKASYAVWAAKTEEERRQWGAVSSERVKRYYAGISAEKRAEISERARLSGLAWRAKQTPEKLAEIDARFVKSTEKYRQNKGRPSEENIRKAVAAQKKWRQEHPEEVDAVNERMRATKLAKSHEEKEAIKAKFRITKQRNLAKKRTFVQMDLW